MCVADSSWARMMMMTTRAHTSVSVNEQQLGSGRHCKGSSISSGIENRMSRHALITRHAIKGGENVLFQSNSPEKCPIEQVVHIGKQKGSISSFLNWDTCPSRWLIQGKRASSGIELNDKISFGPRFTDHYLTSFGD